MPLRENLETQQFVKAARAFCQLVENPAAEKEVWLKAVLVNLAQLYATAHSLPVVEVAETESISEDKFDVDTAEWKSVFQSIGHMLGPARWYWLPYDPSEQPNENAPLETGDLADDLADIYRDIKPGLRAWDEDRDKYLPEIIWSWRETLFAVHWGVHAVNALRVLHLLVFSRGFEP